MPPKTGVSSGDSGVPEEQEAGILITARVSLRAMYHQLRRRMGMSRPIRGLQLSQLANRGRRDHASYHQDM